MTRGPLTLDVKRLLAQWNGQRVDLTLTEFWMVHALARFPGHVKDRDSLMRDARIVVDDSTITSHMKRIRRKFAAIDPAFDRIDTVYGMGYRWTRVSAAPRFALGIRAQLLLVLTVFLVIPFLGWGYVRELERVLRDAQERKLAGTAQAVATALHDRARLFDLTPVPLESLAAERGVGRWRSRPATERAPFRIRARWPRSRRSCRGCRGRPRASGSSTAISTCSRARARCTRRRRAPEPARGRRRRARAPDRAHGAASALRARARAADRGIRRGSAGATLAEAREVAGALAGILATDRRPTPDGRAVVVSAAHPIWVGDEVRGAVIVEETANSVLAQRNRAFERLFTIVLAALLVGSVALTLFASRLTARIRKLRDDAEAAIDAQGRVRGALAGSQRGR